MICEFGDRDIKSLSETLEFPSIDRTLPFVCVSWDPDGHCEPIGVYAFDVPVTDVELDIVRDALELCLPLNGCRGLTGLFARAKKMIDWQRVRDWHEMHQREDGDERPFSLIRKFVSVQLGSDCEWYGWHCRRLEPEAVLRQFRERLSRHAYDDIVRTMLAVGHWFAEDNQGMNMVDVLRQAAESNQRELDEAFMTTMGLDAFAPPAHEADTFDEAWPVDEHGDKLPINEWTVSDLGVIPDSLRDEAIKLLRKNGCEPGAKLLEKMLPSEIGQCTEAANAILGDIINSMGLQPVPEKQ